MGRQRLTFNSRHMLARKILAQQPLADRIARQQQLLRAYGLTADTLQQPSIQEELDFNWMPQSAFPSARVEFRAPLIGQVREVTAVPSARLEYPVAQQVEEPLERETPAVAQQAKEPLEQEISVLPYTPLEDTLVQEDDQHVSQQTLQVFIADSTADSSERASLPENLAEAPHQHSHIQDQETAALTSLLQMQENALTRVAKQEDTPVRPDLKSRATARVAPTIQQSSQPNADIVGATLAVARENGSESAPLGDAPTMEYLPTQKNVPTIEDISTTDDNISSRQAEDAPIKAQQPSTAQDDNNELAIVGVEPGAAQPIETKRAKRPRARIEEQPTSATYNQSVAPRNDLKSKAPAAKSSETTPRHESPPTDELFAPRDTDRSPQAWLARLKRASGAAPEAPGAAKETKSTSPQTGIPGGTRIPARGIPTMDEAPQQDHSSMVGIPLAGILSGRQVPTSTMDEAARDVSTEPRVPAQLSQQTRQFLRPLVGIDPTSVRVYRDPLAERLTDAYRADAITIGDEVALAAGHPDDEPETLGLLAHEFTHVARAREPRFIPPVVRSMHAMPSTAATTSKPSFTALDDEAPANGFADVLTNRVAPADEETLAQRVESRVTRAAQAYSDQATTLPETTNSGVTTGTSGPGLPSRTRDDRWGGLPAPWEPLPAWLVASPTTESNIYASSAASQVFQGPGGATNITAGVYNAAQNSGIAENNGVQRAGIERSDAVVAELASAMSPSAAPSSPAATSPDSAKVPEPDLDALARQVYAHLKRRLAVEQRRKS